MSISSAFSIIFERRPELRMEGWFASDADTISLKSWDQIIGSQMHNGGLECS
ncbi:hypothetical protein V6Z12_A10G046100 [Gossypium hirsutum]